MQFNPTLGFWLNKPNAFSISENQLEITTEANTDFWQRTYYGFRNDNAPALQIELADNFTFTAKVSFDYKKLFDQCGLIIYLDENNWFKAAIEYENATFSRLGSVVTNQGYSDWATQDIQLPREIWYRLSRRGPDFLVEYSLDGKAYQQLRIFHLHALGETTPDMGTQDPPEAPKKPVPFGLYACSPSESSFTACFTEFNLTECQWRSHQAGS